MHYKNTVCPITVVNCILCFKFSGEGEVVDLEKTFRIHWNNLDSEMLEVIELMFLIKGF